MLVMLFHVVICLHRVFRNDTNLKHKFHSQSRVALYVWVVMWCSVRFRCAAWHYVLFAKLEDLSWYSLHLRINFSIHILQINLNKVDCMQRAVVVLRISNHFFHPLGPMEHRTYCNKIFLESKTSQTRHLYALPASSSLPGRVYETVRDS